jgi:hypothetical protein
MTEEEARSIMKRHGWTYLTRSPKGVAKYVYALRKQRGKLLDCYVCPLSRLSNLTEPELIAKLAQPPAEKP